MGCYKVMWPQNTIDTITYNSFKNQISRLNNLNRKIYIWGAGVRGILCAMVLQEEGINFQAFIDSDSQKHKETLNGYRIIGVEEIDLPSSFIIVTMENNKTVVRKLYECGLSETIDYLCLNTNVDIEYVKKIMEDKENLIVGSSLCAGVPYSDKCWKSIQDILADNKSIACAGISCLSMKLIYYSLLTRCEKSKKLKNFMFLFSWENVLPFGHLLPRTQKPMLLKCLLNELLESKYAGDLVNEIKEEIELAEVRSENYEFENIYSPQRINNAGIDLEYARNSILASFEESCEEVNYLRKLSEYLLKNKIQCFFIIEPINHELANELLGEKFYEEYGLKVQKLQNYLKQFSWHVYDASYLFGQSEYEGINSFYEGLMFSGRKKLTDKMLYLLEN